MIIKYQSIIGDGYKFQRDIRVGNDRKTMICLCQLTMSLSEQMYEYNL